MILTKEAKRLGIFFFYDKDGVVDEYVFFYLRNMLPYLSQLLVVCNGKLTIDGRQQLEQLDRTTVLVRENKGFDVWAYKTGMEYYGFENMNNYDELIMFNFTIMGPVCDLQEMFDSMNERDLDFWGLTIHNGAPFDPWGLMEEGKIPVHIQSHFIAVRKKMLTSFEFSEYWRKMPMINCYEEAVGMHEAIFTKKFEECGYKWDVYVDTNDLLCETFYPMFNMPVELIHERKCPFFKRKLFIHDWNDQINENGFHAAADLYRYLKEQAVYDVDMLEKHILRTGNLTLFLNAINARYILGEEEQNVYNRKTRVAFIISIEENTHQYYRSYLRFIPKDIPCYILASEDLLNHMSSEKEKKNNDIYVKRDTEFPETQLIKLMQEIQNDYDYICNLFDISGKYLQILTNIRSFAKNSYECMVKSASYIDEVLNLFEENHNLGILMPMAPVHSSYFGISGNEWGCKQNYEIICDILDTLECDVPISYDIRPVVSLSGCIWFRTAAVKRLLEYKDIKSLEKKFQKGKELAIEEKIPDFWRTLCTGMKYIWAYVAQKDGFYSSYVCPQSVAANMLVNYDNIIGKINKDFQNPYSLHGFLFDQNADFVRISINFDLGSGYMHKYLQSQIIIRKKYFIDDVSVKFAVKPNAKEIIINIADGLMCICKGTKFIFMDEENCEMNLKYRISDNADLHTKDGVNVFFESGGEYRLNGDFSDVNEIIIQFKQLVVIPIFEGAKKILRKEGIKGSFRKRKDCIENVDRKIEK